MLCMCGGRIYTQPRFAVFNGGECIGYVRSVDEFETILARTEQTASDILGYDYTIPSDISCRFVPAAEPTDPVQLEDMLLSTVDGVAKSSIITVDGEAVAAVQSDSEAQEVLNDLLRKFTSEDSSSSDTQFVNSVQVDSQYVAESDIKEAGQVANILSSGNNGEPLVNVKTTKTVSHVESIPYETEYIYDDSLYEGTSYIEREGTDGSVLIVEEETYIDGEFSFSSIKSSGVLIEPVNKIVVKGTKFVSTYPTEGFYQWPTEGIITSNFGYRNVDIGSSGHEGLDIGAPSGTPIVASASGTVIFSDWYYGYGYLIIVEHVNGNQTYYAHCSELYVAEGDSVEQGELIGAVGCTGISSGDHLHFAIKIDGIFVDPEDYLPQ